MKTLNSIRFALFAAGALFTHAVFAGKPTPPPPPPPPPSSRTLVLDYLGLEGSGAANFGLTVAPSGAIYASGVSGDSAIVLASGDSGNSWSLADIFRPPGRYVTYLEIAGGITSDVGGNLYVTGWTWDDAADQWYVRRSTDGGATWATVDDFPHNASGDVIGIAADAAGDVYVAGNWAWTVRKGTVAYSSAGDLLWENHTSGIAGIALAIAVDSSGNVFVAGDRSSGFSAYQTIGFSNSGVPLWTNYYNGPGNDAATAMAVDRSGNVFVTGYSGPDLVTIKYSSSIPLPRLDFQKLNNQLVLNWTNVGFNLQSAPALTGPFTNLPAATSPYTNPPHRPATILPAQRELTPPRYSRRKAL